MKYCYLLLYSEKKKKKGLGFWLELAKECIKLNASVLPFPGADFFPRALPLKLLLTTYTVCFTREAVLAV